jgi:hypothetical protein
MQKVLTVQCFPGCESHRVRDPENSEKKTTQGEFGK